MAVAEPANELWTAVKAIANPWPPDNEDDVKNLADDWRKAGETAHLAGTDLSDARIAAQKAWRDQNGTAMGQQLGNGAVTLASQKQQAEQQAVLADRYAAALVAVKNAIVQTIEMNLPAYLQLANPIYGAAGLAEQQKFAQRIAQQLQGMVANQTQGLQKPPDAPETDTALGTFGDFAGAVAAVTGGLALIPGLQPLAGVALLAGGVALATHAVDLFATGSYDDPWAWAGLGSDVAGMVPGVRAVGEALDVARQAPKALDYVNGGIDTLLQVPAITDPFTDSETVDDAKDLAGGAALNKTLFTEGLRRLP